MRSKPVSIQNKDIFKAIHRSQHCQRNWDLDVGIPQEDIDTVIEAITQCPSKQNKNFYNIHLLQDRETIEKLHDMTKGFGLADTSVTTNSQTLAHLCIVFEAVNTEKMIQQFYRNLTVSNGTYNSIDWDNHTPDPQLWSSCESDVQRDQHMAVGIAAGYANITGSLLGYGTGCCACFDEQGIKDLLNLEEQPLLIMGIGVPGNKPRRVHHLDDSIKFPTIGKAPIAVKVH